MSTYNELLEKVNSLHIVEESVSGKIGQILRKVKGRLDIEKAWNDPHLHTKYSRKDLPDDDYNKIDFAFANMRKAETFSEYKKHYISLCQVTGIPREHVTIIRYKLSKDKEHNSVEIVYNTSPMKITIPNGSSLYHMSTCNTIDALEPQFKGKSAKKYLYSSPRVYFTLRKKMDPFAADIKRTAKITLYTATESIKSAYIDPQVPLYSYGAVYVETNHPIRVEKVRPEKESDVKKESVDDDFALDGPNFTSLEEFMEYYGLEFADDEDVYNESFREKIGELTRKIDGRRFIKNTWENISKNIKRQQDTIKISEKTTEELKSKYETVSTTENFSTYKRAYTWICNLFKLPSKSTVIEDIKIDDKTSEVDVRYSTAEPKKIIIPTDTQLLHVSPVDNITELKPTFRSKVKGKYLYPSKRIYFTIGKNIPGHKAGLENTKVTKYTPKETIKTAYIDPACSNFNVGAIFVNTSLPIPVKKLDNTVKESTEDLQLDIYEAYHNEVISEEERDFLLENCK